MNIFRRKPKFCYNCDHLKSIHKNDLCHLFSEMFDTNDLWWIRDEDGTIRVKKVSVCIYGNKEGRMNNIKCGSCKIITLETVDEVDHKAADRRNIVTLNDGCILG